MSVESLPAVFVDLDVGKSDHHAVAVTAAGKTVHDWVLPDDEARLRDILEELTAEHGPVLMVVDQPASIGTLSVAVAQTTDEVAVAYLPGLAGFDDDLTTQITAASNRLRGMLTQIRPALARVLGPRVTHPAVADLLTRYSTPAKPATAGRGHVRARLQKHAPRLAEPVTEEVFDALARRRTEVLFAMLRDGTLCPDPTDPQSSSPVALAA